MALVFLAPVAALILIANRKNPRYRAFGAVAAGLCLAVAFGNILTYTNGKARYTRDTSLQLRYIATNVSLSQLEAALKKLETTAVYMEWGGEAENTKARQAVTEVSSLKPVQILCYDAAGDGEKNAAAVKKLQLRLGIKILPSLLLVRNGQVIRRLEGAQAIVGGIPLFLQIRRMEEYAFLEVPVWPHQDNKTIHKKERLSPLFFTLKNYSAFTPLA